MLLDFLERFALVEEKSQFVRVQRLKRKEVTKPMRHIFTQIRSQPSILAAYNLSVDAVHKHHSLFAVDLSQPHLDNFAVACLHHAPGKL